MRDISSPLDGFSSPFGPQRNRTLQSLLFGQTEPGFTFEPWDITTLYQDRAGTTPVTADGQSVGLRLDKSQGLRQGPELFTTFTSVGAGWVDNGNGSWTITNAASSSDLRVDFATSVLNKRYKIQYSVSGSVGSSIAYHFNTNPGSLTTGTFNSSLTVFATFFIVRASIGATITVSGVSMKEIAGNHEVAVSDAKRGVYGWMPKTGRRNLLTYTEQFDNAAWTRDNGTVTINAGTDPIGGSSADLFVPNTTTTFHRVRVTTALTVSGQPVSSIYVKAAGYTRVGLKCDVGYGPWTAQFDLSNGTVYYSMYSASITAVGNGWYRISTTAALNSDAFSVYPCDATWSDTIAGDGTSGILIWGAQLEVGSTATAYQRVASQYDITEAGVPTCYYVRVDGVDDAYVTPTITPNTDKAQVFAGLRKLSDAAIGLFVSTGASYASNNGAIVLFSPGSPGLSNYLYRSKGTLSSGLSTPNNYAAPISNIVTGISDISNDFVETRINGVSVVQTLSDQGTGDYQAYPAYIYARGSDGTFPFNGLDFGHAVRFGPNLDAATIARVESLIARNTPEVTL